jgi:hypothetical protein
LKCTPNFLSTLSRFTFVINWHPRPLSHLMCFCHFLCLHIYILFLLQYWRELVGIQVTRISTVS